MAQSVELAQLIQRNVCATAGRPNKGVKQDAFLVLRETSMPACLIELGYITTASEARYLTNPTNVDAMGRGIYQAFVAYKNSHTTGTTPTPPERQEQPEQSTQPEKEEQSQQQTQPEKQEQPQQQTQATDPVQTAPSEQTTDDAPIFKVQILASTTKLSTNNRQLKGLSGVEYYKEGRLYKYTVGSSADYNEIYRLRRQVLSKFPEAFIIAFKNGERVDAAAAYQEFRNRNK